MFEKSSDKYYLWQQPASKEDFEIIKWNLYDDSKGAAWFIYNNNTREIIKTEYHFFSDVLEYLRNQLKVRWPSIIAAAPKNIFDFPEIQKINPGSIVKLEGLNFRSLHRKNIVQIGYLEDENDNAHFKERIEIFFLTIAKTRKEIIQIRDSKLSELKTKFPTFDFEVNIVYYYTYNMAPACFRTIDEIYVNYLEEQEELEKEGPPDAYYEALYDKPDPEYD